MKCLRLRMSNTNLELNYPRNIAKPPTHSRNNQIGPTFWRHMESQKSAREMVNNIGKNQAQRMAGTTQQPITKVAISFTASQRTLHLLRPIGHIPSSKHLQN